jgi:hypothetical protein
MIFKKHLGLEGRHAFLSASKSHWVNYDDNKLSITYRNHLATLRGTRYHEFACECILLGEKLPRKEKTLNKYVNDAIGFKMTPEQTLYYSDNCFGTTDAISFKDKLLRIHDLKTGVSKSNPRQTEVYAALFCLEYDIKPSTIDIECRIYQSDEVLIHIPCAEDIVYIMDKIVTFDKYIDKLKIGG